MTSWEEFHRQLLQAPPSAIQRRDDRIQRLKQERDAYQQDAEDWEQHWRSAVDRALEMIAEIRAERDEARNWARKLYHRDA